MQLHIWKTYSISGGNLANIFSCAIWEFRIKIDRDVNRMHIYRHPPLNITERSSLDYFPQTATSSLTLSHTANTSPMYGMTEIHWKNVNFDNCKSAAIFEVEIKERQAPRLGVLYFGSY